MSAQRSPKTAPNANKIPWSLLAFLLLTLTVIISYSNGLSGPFIFDDIEAIPQNASLQSLTTAIHPPPRTTVMARPMLNLSLWLNYSMGGTAVRGYHLLNITIHLLASLVLFGLVRRTLMLPTMKSYQEVANPLALAVALLWQVHPLQTAAVTYIIQRGEAMVALLYMLMLYCLCRSTRAAAPKWWLVATVVVCAVGMLTKEVMVTAPLAALFYYRLFVAESLHDLVGRWRLFLPLLATMVIPFALLGASDSGRAAHDPLVEPLTRFDYMTTQFEFMWRYLRQIVWPDALVFDYGRHVCRDVGSYLPGLGVVVIGVGATLWGLRRNAPLAFAGVAYFGILAPTSIVKISTQTGAEHRLYLPIAVPIFLFVLGGYLAWRRWGRGRWSVVAVVCLIIVGPLSWQTRQRNRDYRSSEAIWRDTAQKWPTNARAQLNLGSALARQRRFGEAIAALDRAIAARSRYFDAYLNRGLSYQGRGDTDRALADYATAIDLRPERPEPYYWRGAALAKRGKHAAAVEQYDKALAVDGSFGEAYFNRGNARLHLRQLRLAVGDYSKSIELGLQVISARNNRSIAHVQLGQYDKARVDVEAVKLSGAKPNAKVVAFLERAGR